jgi:hypothetical protein
MTAALALIAFIAPKCPHAEERVSVTVVVVLATTENENVDKALAELAKVVQKHEPKLTGFKVEAVCAKSIAVGGAETFALVETAELKITVTRPEGRDGRVALTLSAPGVEKLTYCCACHKFFPIATDYRTKGGEVLIVAVMGKPCMLGKKK